MRFQGLFTPLLRVLFTFPLRYWFTIGLPVVFRLSGWCRQVQTGFLRPRPTQGIARVNVSFAYRAITCYGQIFQSVPLKTIQSHVATLQPQWARSLVWPLPISLATTLGITFVFFSSSYLDVSVQRVNDILSSQLHWDGLPHSDTYGSTLVCNSP